MSDLLEKGRDALENWANWSRLDSSDTGYPSRCSYYTPPAAGDVWDGVETLPPIDTVLALRIESLVIGMGYTMRLAVRLRYIDRYRLDRVARAVRMERHRAENMLIEAEKMAGRVA